MGRICQRGNYPRRGGELQYIDFVRGWAVSGAATARFGLAGNMTIRD
jgi:hypothetical protein